MGRAPRADEAGGIYYALNRGNARHDIFCKDADFEAYKRLVDEALQSNKGVMDRFEGIGNFTTACYPFACPIHTFRRLHYGSCSTS